MKKKLRVKDKKISVNKHFKKKRKKDKKVILFPKDVKKNYIDMIMSYNLHIGGLERFCVHEMQFFVSVVKQNTSIIDLKFFCFNFIRAVRFLHLVSRQGKKVFFLGLPLGIEKPFIQLLKELNKTHRLKSFVIKKEITGILTNFRKLKFKQKLEGVSLLPRLKGKKISEWFLVDKKKRRVYSCSLQFKKKSGKKDFIKLKKTSKWVVIEKKKKKKKRVYTCSLQSEKDFRKWLKNNKIFNKKLFEPKTLLKSKKLDLKTKPSLIFVFQPLEHKNFIEKLSALNVPIMGFVNTSDPISWYDFPIPGNTNSLKGSFFVYKFFRMLFRLLPLPKIKPKINTLKRLDKKLKKKSNFVHKDRKRVKNTPSKPYFSNDKVSLNDYLATRKLLNKRKPGRRFGGKPVRK